MLADILDVARGSLFKRAAPSQVSRSSPSSGSQSAERVVPCQAGVIAGVNPIAFDQTDPLRLWVIQVGASVLSPSARAFRLLCPRVDTDCPTYSHHYPYDSATLRSPYESLCPPAASYR